MPKKKVKRLSVAQELHHVVGELIDLRHDMSQVKESISVTQHLITIKNNVEKRLDSDSVPPFDLEVTMKRDGGKCNLVENKKIFPTRIICTDVKSEEREIILLYTSSFNGKEGEYVQTTRRNGTWGGRQMLYTLGREPK